MLRDASASVINERRSAYCAQNAGYNDSGPPAAGEFLDMVTPQYLADLRAGAPLARGLLGIPFIANWRLALVRLLLKWH